MNEGTILLIEDNPDDVALTRRAFSKNNIRNQVDVAGDGEEALRYLLAGDPDRPLPALVLLDINLPRVNGLDVLRAVRSDDRTQFLPVVVLTTSGEERDIVESYHLGANSYVRKPVVFSEFLEAVRALGLYWLLINQPVVPPPAVRD
jgi:two-component system response regulator